MSGYRRDDPAFRAAASRWADATDSGENVTAPWADRETMYQRAGGKKAEVDYYRKRADAIQARLIQQAAANALRNHKPGR